MTTGYLLDTSICVFFLRNQYGVAQRMRQLGQDKCFISDVTVAELMFGAYRSANVQKNLELVKQFVAAVQVVPFAEGIDTYSREKARLWAEGTPVEDFDLLIAASAITRGLVMVTDNIRHFEHVRNIKIENWIDRNPL